TRRGPAPYVVNHIRCIMLSRGERLESRREISDNSRCGWGTPKSLLARRLLMAELHLTPEQEAEAQALFERLKAALEDEARHLARLLASKDDRHLLGATEFEVRDRVHRLGAGVLQAALAERKKRGTRAAAAPAPTATKPPSASPSA